MCTIFLQCSSIFVFCIIISFDYKNGKNKIKRKNQTAGLKAGLSMEKLILTEEK